MTSPFAPVARSFQCRCGRPIFFRNSYCLGCKAPLGYDPSSGKLYPLDPAGSDGLWKAEEGLFRRCANLNSASGCNWLVSEPTATLCKSCRLDRTIPDLSIPVNQEWYRRISIAKRRLVSALITLGLPVASKINEDPGAGLAFDFLRRLDGAPPVMTGHQNGIITLNVEEAEDATRERIRTEMGEDYRTLLGHLRHEVGHYYWDRLVAQTDWLACFRQVFGDERINYGMALQTHYRQGPPADWQQRFVSAYASAHPWEDWAETWAHYLHMIDTFNSALSFGLDPDASIEMDVEPFGPEALFDPEDADFLKFFNSWIRLTAVLNELSRAMGLNDFCPFVLSRGAVRKLHLVHKVIRNGHRAL